MVIAVNTHYFLKADQQYYSRFLFECFSRLTKQHPEHTFIFFTDGDAPPFGISENNVLPVNLPKKRPGILQRFFYKSKIYRLLKKHRVNVFLNADGQCALSTKVPQGFFLANADSFFDKEFTKKNRLFFYKNYLPAGVKKAKVVFTNSQVSKNFIIGQFNTEAQRIEVVYGGAKVNPAAIEWEEKETIKSRYAGGNEYFLFYGDTSRENILLNLLRAFSHFKKWQKSGMQLLIVEKNTFPGTFVQSLTSFKYRKDVIFLKSLPQAELTDISAAAYCLVLFPVSDIFFFEGLQAMRCNVPLITADTGTMHEVFEEAALYANFKEPLDIGDKLILIFKDEELRKDLIEKGSKAVQRYTWEKTSGLLWQCLLKAGA